MRTPSTSPAALTDRSEIASTLSLPPSALNPASTRPDLAHVRLRAPGPYNIFLLQSSARPSSTMAMRGVLQGYDASAREIPGAAPSAAVTILAAQLRPSMPHELKFIISALLRFFGQYPCPCPVSPNLDLDVQASLQVVLILDYHGRDSQRLSGRCLQARGQKSR